MFKEISSYDEAQLIHDAIMFAEKAHRGQKCSGTDAVYMIHAMEVLQILESAQAPLEVKLAGILHESLQNTAVSYEDIAEYFGAETAALVAFVTADKTRGWYERKSLEIDKTETADFYEKLVVMADVISNMRQLLYRFKREGSEIWAGFPVKKDDIEWYYSKIQDAMYDLSEVEEVRDVYWEMVDLFKELFVHFFQVDDKYLLQATATEVHLFNPTDVEWYDISDQISLAELADIDGCVEISQELAEQLEDLLTVGTNVQRQSMFDNNPDSGNN